MKAIIFGEDMNWNDTYISSLVDDVDSNFSVYITDSCDELVTKVLKEEYQVVIIDDNIKEIEL